MKKQHMLISFFVVSGLFLLALWQKNTGGMMFIFVLAIFDVMLLLNGKMEARMKNQSRNYQILQRTFGPFTWLAVYGSLGILASLVILNLLVSTLWTARIMLIGMVVYFLWAIVLCVLVAAGKNHNRE